MRLCVPAFAKVNWMLEVLGRRPDGYHEIRTVLQTIDLTDELVFDRADEGIVLTCSHPDVPTGEANLVFRAAQLLQRVQGGRAGARIHIEKRIPVAAGLGGGSSDAAVTVLALARMWELELESEVLFELGRALGSDVPFFFLGGTALGIGRGDEVYPLPEIGTVSLLLAHPGFAIPTVWAYQQLTKRDGPSNISLCSRAWYRAVRACEGGQKALPLSEIVARNDFEDVVRARYPELARGLDRMRELGAYAAGLSGSGPTIFGVFDNEEALADAEDAYRRLGWWCARAHTVNRQQYWARLAAGLAGEASAS
jgi:4-diphosphocytidyl-2-C-methyl-D-erythritol kinase